MTLQPVHDLAARLIRCPSVTPAEGGALDLLQDELTQIGFTCHRLPFGDGEDRIDNLFAIYGDDCPHFVLLVILMLCLLIYLMATRAF